jgi:aspartate/methionine/tyrosine aminotransferase
MPRLARRTQFISPFEVMEVQALARSLEQQGHDIIHLEIGEPDFRTPEPIIEAARQALLAQPMNYTSALGIMPLRMAIAKWYRDVLQVDVAAERIVVTAGSSAALLLALAATVDAGDEVIMGDPTYPCNRHFVRTLEAIPNLLATEAAAQFQLTTQQVASALGERTRAVIIASPANPTGTCVTTAQWQAMGDLCRGRDVTLIADEIYQGLVYDEPPSTALASVPDAWVINSFSKYFQMTGWRLGWLVAPEGLTRTIETLAQNLFISPSTPAQYAALAAFTPATLAIAEARREELQRRRDFLLTHLPALGLRIPAVPQGAFYIYADVSAVTDDAYTFARDVLTRGHVAITPGNDFGIAAPERHVRIAYTQPIAALERALERIRKIVG